MIFHDATLLEMLENPPTSLDEMRALPGIGDAKLARYGETFLEVIAEGTREPSA